MFSQSRPDNGTRFQLLTNWKKTRPTLPLIFTLALAGSITVIPALHSSKAREARTAAAGEGTFYAEGGVPVAQQAPSPLTDPPTPVKQAQEIGLGQCASILGTMSHDALTTQYDVQSGWSRIDPKHHVFQSVAALHTLANDPPDGLAALIAAPVSSGGCDGVLVQVFPLAGDCQSAQKVMLQTGKLLAPMLGTRIMLDARSNRVILLPAFANTCIAISVDTLFGPVK